jgi:type I restriction enzyme M protein
VQDEIVANLPSRGGKTRAITKEDFSQKSAIYLKPEAQFDYLVVLTDADDRAEAIIQAMEAIETDYSNLRGQLPKQEYRTIPDDVLGMLLRAP